METHPIKVDGNDKLHWLRRLDTARSWEFLDDQRYCFFCGRTFLRASGSTRRRLAAVWSLARGLSYTTLRGHAGRLDLLA
jgi:hypothetical protein